MKQFLIVILTLLLLTGCGAKTAAPDDPEQINSSANQGETEPEGAAAPSELSIGPEDAAAPSGLSVELEQEVYDPSLSRYTYFVRNNTDKTVDFGEPYRIQRRSSGRWADLTPKEGYGFISIGYCLAPGKSMALICDLGMYVESPQAGEYRLVKTVDGHTLYGEFRIGNSLYTKDMPYGFTHLEDLPEDYGPDKAAPADAVFTGSGIRNLEAVESFLSKVESGAECQLRTVQDYGEGAVLVTDVICENGHFLRRERSGGVVTEGRYSYLVTDGEDLYLSNGADWASGGKYGAARALLIPEGVTKKMISAVEAMTAARLEGNVTRYRIWSGDGIWDASLTDTPTEFGVGWQKTGEGSRGSLYDLQNWDGMETEILRIAWQADGTLLLECGTASGERSRLCYDPVRDALTSAR